MTTLHEELRLAAEEATKLYNNDPAPGEEPITVEEMTSVLLESFQFTVYRGGS